MEQENENRLATTDEHAAQEQTQSDFATRDLEEFLERHGGVDVARLMENGRFLRFCGSRLGRESLATLYEDFVALVDDAGAAAAERVRSRSARSTGGGTAGGATLSPAQKKVLDAWNEEHPEMAMTAREFLER